MVIRQILNNNLISCLDEAGEEVLLMGKGIGWGVKAGQDADMEKVEKVFRMDSPRASAQLRQLFIEVDEAAIRASLAIVEDAKKSLRKRLNKNIYITLTDHISFAVERNKNGITFPNALRYGLQAYYKDEYEVGKRAIGIVYDKMGEKLPEEEAGSIALHIINSEYDYGMEKTMEVVNLVQKSLDIIRYGYNATFDEDSLNYQRFVTHLVFFAERVIEDTMLDDMNLYMKESLQQHYPREYSYAIKIKDLAEKQYDRTITEEEVIFLCVHIVRVTKRSDDEVKI